MKQNLFLPHLSFPKHFSQRFGTLVDQAILEFGENHGGQHRVTTSNDYGAEMISQKNKELLL